MDFFWNKGSETSRVWHWTTDLQIFQRPESVREWDSDVIDWDAGIPRNTALIGSPRWYDPDMMFSMRNSQMYPILGKTHYIAITPAHEYYIASAKCGSVETNRYGHTTNLRSINTPHRNKQHVGKTITYITDKVVKAPVVQGADIPPEPFCRHCEKMMTKEGLI